MTLEVQRGEFAFVVGPTGCGKSTLIKLLIGEVKPASGHVLIAGRDLQKMPAKKLPLLRRRIGTVFQDFKLLPNRTVYDNVAYALQVTGGTRADIRRKVPEILRLVGLQTKIHNYPDELSGGEQQRVSIARAFVNHPPLLLADEPTGNLDPETSIGIMQLLYRINRTGTTVLVVTHDREMVDKMRRRVIALETGRLVRDEHGAGYHDESTREFAARMRAELGLDGGPPPRRTRSMSRITFFIAEALRAMRRNAAPSVAAIVTIVVTTLLFGVLVPVLWASASKTNDVRNQIEQRVFLSTTPRSRDRRAPAAAAVFRTYQRSGSSTRQQLSGSCGARVNGPLKNSISQLKGNPLPRSFNVKVDDADNLEAVRQELVPPGPAGAPKPISPIIQDVNDSRQQANTIRRVTSAVEIVLGVIAALLLSRPSFWSPTRSGFPSTPAGARSRSCGLSAPPTGSSAGPSFSRGSSSAWSAPASRSASSGSGR